MTLTSNLVKANFLLEDFLFNDITDGTYTVDLTDCKGEIDLVIDAAGASAEATVTVIGGEYVGKLKDTAYTVPAGSCKRISISSGETMQRDGNLHLQFANASGVRVAVLKRRYVNNK